MSSPVSTRDNNAATAVDYDPFAEGGSLSRVVPTTEPQREVWLADQLGRDASLAYNESVCLRFKGALDVAALEAALRETVNRHEALRSTVDAAGENLQVAATLELEIESIDLSGLDAAEREKRIAALRVAVVELPFDLARGPLVRAQLVKRAADDHQLIFTAHHIVCDGWSFGIIVKDLAAAYRRARGEPVVSPAADSFASYAANSLAALGGEQNRADEQYWVSRFPAPLPVLDLPTDRARPALRTFRSNREDVTLDAARVAEIKKFGAKNGASLFATLLAGFAATLHRVLAANEPSDLVIGVPAAGQSAANLDHLVGHCVNLLPIRLEVQGGKRFPELLSACQSGFLDAFEHQQFTFGSLLKKLAVPRDSSRLPLVSVMFNLDQVLDANAIGFPGLDAEFFSNARRYENFELFVNAVQVDGALRFETQYNADLFDSATVRRWLTMFGDLVTAAASQPEAAIDRLPLLPAADREQLATWNRTEAEFPREARVHEIIEAQARKSPEAAALRFGGRVLSYRELDDAAAALAATLRARGAKRGALVGLHLTRGPRLLTSLLAVLKSGAAYVPLDPSYPGDRLHFMAEDAGLVLLVTENAAAPLTGWPAGRTLNLDGQVERAPALSPSADDATPVDPAYVIYTSGSTGKPKGVLVPHRAVVNFLATMAKTPGLKAADKLVAVTTLSFDIAVNELLTPLTVGAEVVLASGEETADGGLLAKLIAASGATTLQATPSTWRMLLDNDWRPPAGFKALTGGEPLTADLAARLGERVAELWNMYGPTETTVWSTCWRVERGAPWMSIGQPIANTSIHVLDEHRAPCPIGVPGEIWIGGEGVTLGYLHRPELTAERFIPDPFSDSPVARLYRTGDKGRWRDGGRLEHLGRLDFQVKVRGFRIELGEIEARMASHPDVARNVTIVREDRPGDVRIVSYVVPKAGAANADLLLAHARQTLPAYMIPQHVIEVASIPLLPNGKVNRRALPAPDAGGARREYVAPRSELERQIAAEMERSLGMPEVSVDDDFFALGGHSLLAAQLTARLNKALSTQLTMRSLFEAPTIAKLAALVESGESAQVVKSIARLADQSRAPMSMMQERLWFMEELRPGRVNYHTPSAHRLTGPMNEAAFEGAMNEMIRRQPSLRTSFAKEAGEVVQRIHEDVRIKLFPAEDLSALPDREAVLKRRLDELVATTFDLSKAPILNAHLFRMGPEEHVLFFMSHHIVWDGWSFDLFYEEMSTLYPALEEGRPHGLSELTVSYADFSAWHRQWLASEACAKEIAFWRNRLGAIGDTRELPTDRPRRPGMSGSGSTEWILLDRAGTDRLHVVAKASGTTLFITTLAIYAAMLHAYSGQRNLVIGVPVRGRNVLELERIMGYFNNLIPLRIDVDPGESFAALIARVKDLVTEGLKYPDVPLEHLAQELAVARGSGGTLLYQALFSFQDARQRITRWGGLTHHRYPVFQHGANEDMGLWFVEADDGLHGGVTYNDEILEAGTARMLRDGYRAMMDALLANPGLGVEDLARPLATAAAAHRAGAAPAEAATAAAPRETGAGALPATDTEKLIADLWKTELRLPAVSLEDNFFDLGGHSLLAMQIMGQIEKATGKRINPQRFVFDTLGQLALAYDDAVPESTAKPAGKGFLSRLFGKGN